jgi:tRNA (uracil-5-)-methyltransferase
MQAAEPQKVIVRKDGSHLVKCYVEDYDRLLAEKVTTLRNLLSWDKDVDVFESERTHFRMRANFQMWHDNPRNKVPSGFYFTMCEPGCGKDPCEVVNFPRGTPLINKLMTDLLRIFQEREVIFKNLFEVRFLTTQTQEAIIVLLYKGPLPDTWLPAAEEVCKELNVKIVGRARKMMQVAGGDEMVKETYTVKGEKYSYYQTEGAFSQPNAGVCEKMITWAMDRTENSASSDLLELYCGGGTFTAPMSRNFRNVLATEISKASVDLAHKNFALNDIKNIKVARLSSEEFTDAYSGKKSFTRLAENGIKLDSYQISTVLVDPPRAGLDPLTTALISQFEKIVYISCNPETLARDVQALSATHEIARVAAFDQFPYTHHLEGGVFLVKKAAAETAAGVGEKHVLDAGKEEEDGNAEKRSRTA